MLFFWQEGVGTKAKVGLQVQPMAPLSAAARGPGLYLHKDESYRSIHIWMSYTGLFTYG